MPKRNEGMREERKDAGKVKRRRECGMKEENGGRKERKQWKKARKETRKVTEEKKESKEKGGRGEK